MRFRLWGSWQRNWNLVSFCTWWLFLRIFRLFLLHPGREREDAYDNVEKFMSIKKIATLLCIILSSAGRSENILHRYAISVPYLILISSPFNQARHKFPFAFWSILLRSRAEITDHLQCSIEEFSFFATLEFSLRRPDTVIEIHYRIRTRGMVLK